MVHNVVEMQPFKDIASNVTTNIMIQNDRKNFSNNI